MSSESEDLVDLSDIVADVNSYINKKSLFKSIESEIQIIELKEYNFAVFVTVSDVDKKVTIRGIIYNSVYGSNLSPGDKIWAKCEMKLYKNELQLVIKSYELSGKGKHELKLEKLKCELDKLGYFDDKKTIDKNYHTIGVISSMNAAGLKDFLHTINSRCSGIKIFIYPAVVQGDTAPKEICSAIKLALTHNLVQILVIIRGGGSKDDLECFNNRDIAISIFKCKLPIVTGIGHQIDTSIADLVADKNFITPTATAQSITTENLITKSKLKSKIKEIKSIFQTKFDLYYNYIKSSELQINKLKNDHITHIKQTLKYHSDKLSETINKINLLSTLQYSYLIESENRIFNTATDTLDKISANLNIHKHNSELININISNSLIKYSNKLSKLASPKIVSLSGREITMLADLEPNKTYQIKFLDGCYDIKIFKHIK